MPKFAANLTMMFNEAPFLDRFEAAARAGFEAVEFMFPYEHEPDEVATRLRANGLALVLNNLPAGEWAAGERGIACLPGREAEFREGVAKAIRYATALGCPQLNCLVGLTPKGADPRQVEETLVGNLRFAAEQLRGSGIGLLLEAVNTRDIPGFHLTGTKQVRDLIEANGLPNTRIQYDIYHMQVMEGDLARTISANLDLIGHVQLADNPGRNEPGTGEINFEFLFDHLDASGYAGWIGCEYKPRGGTVEGLGWLPRTQRERAVA